MARIKITDLPKDQKISKEELKRVKGGLTLLNTSLTLNQKYDVNTSFLKMEVDSSVATAGIETFDKW